MRRVIGYKIVFLLCVLVVLSLSCSRRRTYFPDSLPDVEVQVVRFDSALLSVRSDSVRYDIHRLYDEYPTFMPFFVENILGIPSIDTLYLETTLPEFLADTVYGFKATNQREKELFSDITPIRKSLSRAFAHVHYVYPEWEIPKVWFFISGFNASVLFVEDGIAVGADMYLGSDYEYYNRVVYDYQKVTMRPECIAVDVVSAWLFKNIPYTSTKNRLLENMIYRGKVMYFLSTVFPDEKDYDVMGYTIEQWEWCEKYERAIWNRIMDKRDLFTTEQRIQTSYLNEGPFTSEVNQDSPGRLGTWVGWRIVESYMEHHSDVSLRQLMEDGDAQKILSESYYKP